MNTLPRPTHAFKGSAGNLELSWLKFHLPSLPLSRREAARRQGQVALQHVKSSAERLSIDLDQELQEEVALHLSDVQIHPVFMRNFRRFVILTGRKLDKADSVRLSFLDVDFAATI